MSTVKSKASQIGKRELLRQLDKAKEITNVHMTISRMLAVELMRTNPKHPAFTDGTFTLQSLNSIKADTKAFATYEEMREARG